MDLVEPGLRGLVVRRRGEHAEELPHLLGHLPQPVRRTHVVPGQLRLAHRRLDEVVDVVVLTLGGGAARSVLKVRLELLLDGRERRTPVGQQVAVLHERALAAAPGPLGEQRRVHPAGDVGGLLGEAEVVGLAGEVGDVARADHLGRVAQRGEPAQVDVELGGHLLPDLGEPEGVRVLDDDLLAPGLLQASWPDNHSCSSAVGMPDST